MGREREMILLESIRYTRWKVDFVNWDNDLGTKLCSVCLGVHRKKISYGMEVFLSQCP